MWSLVSKNYIKLCFITFARIYFATEGGAEAGHHVGETTVIALLIRGTTFQEAEVNVITIGPNKSRFE